MTSAFIRKIMHAALIRLAARLLLGGVFVYASIDKLQNPLDFARIIAGYQILPGPWIGLVAATLPFLELLCGGLLILGIWPMANLICLGSLLMVFIAAMAQAYWRGLKIDCGCFYSAAGGHQLGWETLLRDFVLLLAWFLVFGYYQSKAREEGLQ
jgi:putative oxidoreductase